VRQYDNDEESYFVGKKEEKVLVSYKKGLKIKLLIHAVKHKF
jgi:hypothetical protein